MYDAHDGFLSNPHLITSEKDYRKYLEDFEYIHLEGQPIYGFAFLPGPYHQAIPFFFTKELKIVPFAHHHLSVPSYVRTMLSATDGSPMPIIVSMFEKARQLMDMNHIDSGEENVTYMAIEKWHPTYGHMHDELYNLHTFRQKWTQMNPECPSRCIFVDDPFQTHIRIPNIDVMAQTLFADGFMPLSSDRLTRFSNLIVVRSHVETRCKTFHSFPREPRQLLLDTMPSHLSDAITTGAPFQLFLTRSWSARRPAWHNFEDLTQWFRDREFIVWNPENYSLWDTMYMIHNARTIALFWGSGMTNLVYVDEHLCEKIILLKGLSYDTEPLYIFERLLNRYKLMDKIVVIREKEWDKKMV